MQKDRLEQILEIINKFKFLVRKGSKAIENSDSMSIEELLKALIKLFSIEESVINIENNKPYSTFDYENNVTMFSTQLIRLLVSNHNELKSNTDYQQLLGQRHMAYGFYSCFKNELKSELNILKDKVFEKPLYLGLISYFKNFYGNFHNNEEAINLVCKFYPNENDGYEKKDEITDVLFIHITSAGTPSDRGFAYNGIELIKNNIGNLPIDIIERLLKKYEMYKILNEKVYRNQIFTIIDNSCIEEKEKYKFHYLDSLLIANQMNNNIYKKYNEQFSNQYKRNYIPLEKNLSEDKLILFKSLVETENLYGYWKNNVSKERDFFWNENVIFKIVLNEVSREIFIENMNNKLNKIKLKFNYDNWILDNYSTREIEEKILSLIFKEEHSEVENNYNALTFSLVYLDNYRGMSEQTVNFDHKFIYEEYTNELIRQTETSDIPHFYGMKIHSLSCIVGKNGTGKTSIIDFLRETFLIIINLITNYNLKCEKGYVNELDYKDYNILEENCKFLIVFYLKDVPYYLTNITDVIISDVKPFNSESYKSVNELSKVVYFSNMLSANQDDIYCIKENIKMKLSIEKKTKKDIANTLKNFRQTDYSEATSFIQKRKTLDLQLKREVDSKPIQDNDPDLFNKDLCYQLVFLGYLTQEKFDLYFDDPKGKEIFLISNPSISENIDINKSFKEMMSEELQSLLFKPDAKLAYFSSGQYAKFSFLSKLYWFLEGYKNNIEYFESIVGNNVFSQKDVLLEGETALMFIDEGELYYHPEWQRSYIKTIIDFIKNSEIEAKIQVVITTNSPFMISDILNEDITYLSSSIASVSKKPKESDRTFGQNIHKLLVGNFFMSYTIGEYSRELIENAMRWLADEKEINIKRELSYYFGEEIDSTSYYEKIWCLINKIGEPIYREKLMDMLKNSKWEKESKIQSLLKQQAKIEFELKELRKDGI